MTAAKLLVSHSHWAGEEKTHARHLPEDVRDHLEKHEPFVFVFVFVLFSFLTPRPPVEWFAPPFARHQARRTAPPKTASTACMYAASRAARAAVVTLSEHLPTYFTTESTEAAR